MPANGNTSSPLRARARVPDLAEPHRSRYRQRERWVLGPSSEITVGAPIAGNGVVFVTGGYPPVRPVYAVKAGAKGDISLPRGQTASDAIAWRHDREGTYIPTPLLYRDILYTLNSTGILTAYTSDTGAHLYRARVGGGGAFSASAVAADGRLYAGDLGRRYRGANAWACDRHRPCRFGFDCALVALRLDLFARRWHRRQGFGRHT